MSGGDLRLQLTSETAEPEYNDPLYPSSRVMLESNSENWCTSEEILAPVRRFAPIAFDPFGNAASLVGAAQTALLPQQDSLKMDWQRDGLSFANPPYGARLPPCARKIGEQARRGCEILTLVPVRLDTVWWQKLLAPEIWCAWTGRVSFYELEVELLARHAARVEQARQAGLKPPAPPRYKKVTDALVEGEPAPFAVAVCYAGPRKDRFVEIFSEYGEIYMRIPTVRRGQQLTLGGVE